LAPFWTALIYVFLAEMGDKTQLMTLAFSARYKGRVVLAGVTVATALINLLSVGLGVGVGKLLPVFWINLVAGIAFIVFGIWELRPEDEDEKEASESKLGPFMTVVVAFFLAELGDKTMLAAVAIASRQPQFLQVWLGSTIGLVASNALAIVAGKAAKDRFSAKWLKIAIAIIYIVSGLYAVAQAWSPR
jgi:putative Ca2+/H+ antiporter (TMEM165/GDT1 family)